MALIMLIDDEIEAMKYYVMALKRSGFEVIQCTNPDHAMERVLDKTLADPDLLILDLIMSPGKRYEGRTDCEDGMRTGYLLYKELAEHCPNTPFLVLTNLPNAKVEFPKVAEDVPVCLKEDVPPFDLVKLVKDELGRTRR